MKIAPLMVDVAGFELTDAEKIILAKPSVGGVILFSRNYQTIAQLKLLVASIRQIKPNLLIATDHEGGRVQRFRQGWTLIPAMATLGDLYQKDPEKALTAAFSCGLVLAAELREVGVDFSFAPVLDLDYGSSKVIGDRAFSADAKVVIKLADKLIDGMHKVGMKCVGKHFPGHGFVSADSHHELPIDGRKMSEIEADIAVFKGLIDKLDAIMPAHIIYSGVDNLPAGFSKKWIDGVLRTDLGFEGVIFSDDLSMQGAHFIADIADRVQAAIDVGGDMALICNHPEMLAKVVDNDFEMSEKLHLMQANTSVDIDKMTLENHRKIIQTL